MRLKEAGSALCAACGRRAILLVLFSAGTLAAQELWSWHSVDFALWKARGVEWGLHTRLRTRQGELQQGRSGTILKFSPSARMALIGGYYYGREEDTREEWQNSHRVFAGVEAPVYRRGAVAVVSRGLVERFVTAFASLPATAWAHTLAGSGSGMPRGIWPHATRAACAGEAHGGRPLSAATCTMRGAHTSAPRATALSRSFCWSAEDWAFRRSHANTVFPPQRDSSSLRVRAFHESP
jgi:hypothetical protein